MKMRLIDIKSKSTSIKTQAKKWNNKQILCDMNNFQ